MVRVHLFDLWKGTGVMDEAPAGLTRPSNGGSSGRRRGGPADLVEEVSNPVGDDVPLLGLDEVPGVDFCADASDHFLQHPG